MSRELIDLTGQKYGRLTVLYEVKRDKNNKRQWFCQCECGNQKVIRMNELRDGRTKSCGCINKERMAILGKAKAGQKNISNELVGQNFGKLTVIKDSGERKKGKIIWECKCECGNITYVTTEKLKNGHTSSCGCLKSKGEQKIQEILQNNNIFFEKQKKFDSCKDIRLLSFDFYINNQYLIEYDGIQHFYFKNKDNVNTWNTEENFKIVQKHDKIKNEWCKEHNIPLIRIPYIHLNKLCLEDLLLETSQFIVT